MNATAAPKLGPQSPAQLRDSAAQKLWDAYEIKPGARFYQREFGFYSLDEWKKQGLDQTRSHAQIFGYDRSATHGLDSLGWCEAAFDPCFENKVIEDRGEHEVVQDYAGRHVLFFKGRRNGFMPEYLDHPVKDVKTWKENCEWRLNPETPGRYADLEKRMEAAQVRVNQGDMISQRVIGGFMYLRSLMGPVDLLYNFVDKPELIHACMQTWLMLADAVTAKQQQYVTFDELFLAEDICYNSGPLISPDMVREFLFPYYQQLIANIKVRQLDKSRHIYLQIDTDGWCEPVIPLYKELGMNMMSPMEVASGCDVVEIGKKYPDLIILGGVDKRELAKGKDAIDRMVDRIFPAMQKRGGYIPTCDHGVPAEVTLENYMHYRKRALEFA